MKEDNRTGGRLRRFRKFIKNFTISLEHALSFHLGPIEFNLDRYNKVRSDSKRREETEERVKRMLLDFFKSVIRDIQRVKGIKIPQLLTDEEGMLKYLLGQLLEDKEHILIPSLILTYYCKKYLEPTIYSHTDYFYIDAYAHLVGVQSGGEYISEFYKVYQEVIGDLLSANIRSFEKSFVSKYLMPWGLNYIQELDQSESLVSTLRELIKEGKFSAWGITNEALTKVERELEAIVGYGGAFLVMGQHIPKSVKNYLESFPNLHTASTPSFIRNIRYPTNKLTLYLVKTSYSSDPKRMLQEIRKKWEGNEEAFIWVFPVDTLRNEIYSTTSLENLTNPYLRETNDQLKSFEGTEGFSDKTVLMSLINQSKITFQELLSILPLNVLCPNLTRSESDFIARIYPSIRKKIPLKSLIDLKNLDPKTLAEMLLISGSPDYENDELKILKFSNPPTNEEKEARFRGIADSMIRNATKFWEAIEGY